MTVTGKIQKFLMRDAVEAARIEGGEDGVRVSLADRASASRKQSIARQGRWMLVAIAPAMR